MVLTVVTFALITPARCHEPMIRLKNAEVIAAIAKKNAISHPDRSIEINAM